MGGKWLYKRGVDEKVWVPEKHVPCLLDVVCPVGFRIRVHDWCKSQPGWSLMAW